MTDDKKEDADYSPEYQDEYQRLWHKAAKERDEGQEILRMVEDAVNAYFTGSYPMGVIENREKAIEVLMLAGTRSITRDKHEEEPVYTPPSAL